MSDIAASERRLSAALDRIDYLLENTRNRQPATATADPALQAQLDKAQAENLRLSADLQALHDRPSDSDEQALLAAGERLTGAGREAARLAAANEDLSAANRALIAARDGQGDRDVAVHAALTAEIESLRATRAAEIAQMGDIMAELERLLGGSAQSEDAPFEKDVAPDDAGEVVGFSAAPPPVAGGEVGIAEFVRERDGDDESEGR